MEKALTYQQVYLLPNKGILKSRADANISVEFLGFKLRAPWMPANMSTVINPDIAYWLSLRSYPYIMHRFGDTFEFVKRANQQEWNLISISVGVKQEDVKLIEKIISSNFRVNWITIDIAHGHHVLVEEMIKTIKNLYKNSQLTCPSIIAGNVATPYAVKDLKKWGADAVKVGIAGGAACSTKNQTGFHMPMFTCVNHCYEFGGSASEGTGKIADIPIIADGGIRDNGDIAKAIVAGATLVMAGSMFAACTDAPGENIYAKQRVDYINKSFKQENGPITHKRYYGSASEHQKGSKKHVEGFQVDLACNGLTYIEKYQELKECLQSSVSYAGGDSLDSLRKVNWINV
jgi:GMP reductase